MIIDMCLKSSRLPFEPSLCHWDAVSVNDIILFCGLCDQWLFCLFHLDLLMYYDIGTIMARFVADNGTRKRIEAQLSRRSLSPFFSFMFSLAW